MRGGGVLKAFPRLVLKRSPQNRRHHRDFREFDSFCTGAKLCLTSMVFFEGNKGWAFLDRDGAFAFLHGTAVKVFADKAVANHVQRLGVHAGIASTLRRFEKGWKVVLRRTSPGAPR